MSKGRFDEEYNFEDNLLRTLRQNVSKNKSVDSLNLWWQSAYHITEPVWKFSPASPAAKSSGKVSWRRCCLFEFRIREDALPRRVCARAAGWEDWTSRGQNTGEWILHRVVHNKFIHQLQRCAAHLSDVYPNNPFVRGCGCRQPLQSDLAAAGAPRALIHSRMQQPLLCSIHIISEPLDYSPIFNSSKLCKWANSFPSVFQNRF